MATVFVRILLLLVSALVVYGTICPLIRSKRWYVRTMDFPRVQLLGLALATLAGFLVMAAGRPVGLELALCIVLILCIVLQTARIMPLQPVYPVEVPDAPSQAGATFSLLVANVRYDNESYADLEHLVRERDPDLCLLVEPTDAWMAALANLDDTYPHVLRHPRPEGHGLALWSRHPLSEASVEHLVTDDRPALHVVVELADVGAIRFWGMHPAPPALELANGERKDSDDRDTELLRVARRIEAERAEEAFAGWIVAGDFNDAAWSHTTRGFKRRSGLRDPRVGRGLYSTYHADYPLLRYPIDHVFVSPEFSVIELERGPHIGSDHFPMFVKLAFRKAR